MFLCSEFDETQCHERAYASKIWIGVTTTRKYIYTLDGDYLIRTADGDQTYREIARHSKKDAETYKRFGPLMGQIGMAVRPILETIAPNALKPSLSDLFSTKRLLDHFKTISKEQFEYLTKLMTMSSADF